DRAAQEPRWLLGPTQAVRRCAAGAAAFSPAPGFPPRFRGLAEHAGPVLTRRHGAPCARAFEYGDDEPPDKHTAHTRDMPCPNAARARRRDRCARAPWCGVARARRSC